MDWVHVRLFIHVVASGSLADAARQSGISTATAGRWIDSLEAAVGAKLFRRGRNGSHLTEAGKRLAELVDAPAQAMELFERKAAALIAKKPERHIRISATEPVASEMLAPAMPMLQPELRIEIVSSASVANLNDLDFDIAVRMFRPKDSALVARRIGSAPMGLFASRQFLGTRRPDDIDLAKEPLLMVTPRYGDIAETRWVEANGLSGQVRLYSSSSRVLLFAAQSGAGIAMAAAFQAGQMDLVEIPCPRVPPREFWMVTHRDSRQSGAMHTVKQWVAAAVSKSLASSTSMRSSAGLE
jgi:DNA-binding transcriptional LysR family regulator